MLNADYVVATLAEAANQITLLSTPALGDPMQPAPIPANEEERLAALQKLVLVDTPPEEAFDSATRAGRKIRCADRPDGADSGNRISA